MAKGWFKLPGQDGDRTLEMQTKGLDGIDFDGAQVLDVGCAEGAVSLWCLAAGASFVRGIDVRADFIKRAHELALHSGVLGSAATFAVVDANDVPDSEPNCRPFDVVMMLAVLHKLRDPSAAARRFSRLSKHVVVVRLPPEGAPVIVDDRSKRVPHDIGKALEAEGFKLHAVTRGSFDEWTGEYRRAFA